MVRVAKAATLGSWVTRMTVIPSELSPEHPQNVHAGVRVEVAGRLVGQDQRGLVHQRPGNGHALLLPARHLRRLVVGAVGQAHVPQQDAALSVASFAAGRDGE